MILTEIRLKSQQLDDPAFRRPEELVRWMGAVQAQDYTMAKWAVGMRLKGGTLNAVDEALREGKILRTHILRPTWHFVAAQDIRWMLQLSGERIRRANESFGKSLFPQLDAETFSKPLRHLEKMLEGGRHLTRGEIEQEFDRTGFVSDKFFVRHLVMQAESHGILCSGADKGGKPTYALLEERVAPQAALSVEESLFRLADRYFQSHSPATEGDFVWWSGLSVRQARQAIGSMGSRLSAGYFEGKEMWIHNSCRTDGDTNGGVLHFLPAYDEYLISYKDRSEVLTPEHRAKAFNNYGIFYPVLLHGGRIVGNWKRPGVKRVSGFDVSFFAREQDIDPERIAAAGRRYMEFLGG